MFGKIHPKSQYELLPLGLSFLLKLKTRLLCKALIFMTLGSISTKHFRVLHWSVLIQMSASFIARNAFSKPTILLPLPLG